MEFDEIRKILRVDKDNFERLKEDYLGDLENDKSELEELLTDINGMIDEANDKISEYNEKASEITNRVSIFKDSVEEIVEELKPDNQGSEVYDSLDSLLQIADNRDAYENWLEEWESYATGLDTYIEEIDLLDEVYTDGVDATQEAIEMIDYQHPELEPELEEEEIA